MDELSVRKTAVLDVLDEQILSLRKKLEKVQPFIKELHELEATRRVLLTEKSMTGGGGNAGRAQITQEQVILFLKGSGPTKPAAISEHLGVDGSVVRSHLNRHKDTTYDYDPDTKLWSLIDDSEGAEEDNDD